MGMNPEPSTLCGSSYCVDEAVVSLLSSTPSDFAGIPSLRKDTVSTMQRHDGRGEPARERWHTEEMCGSMMAKGGEMSRGDPRARSQYEREATRRSGARGWTDQS